MKRFYLFLLAFLCLSWGFEANAQVISTLPWSDDFEGGFANWIVESEDADYEWIIANGNPLIYSNLHNAHSGTNNAYLYSYDYYASTLLSPVFNLADKEDVVVSFWYAMQKRDVSYGKEYLTLYYRKSSSDSWVELIEVTNDAKEWSYVQVHLTDLSSTVQFKFEGSEDYGYGILLDDITVRVRGDYWTDEGNYDISWYDESDAYTFSTAAQLAGLAYLVNNETDFEDATFTLASDIDLSGHEWVSIGNTSDGYVFDGVFDGNNHVIDHLVSFDQNFSDYYGLFGSTGWAEIKNLTIGENSCISADADYVGGVVGYFYAATTVTNCNNKATLSGSRYVGGITGYVSDYGTCYITNCFNYGNVSATYDDYAGGIVGYIYETIYLTSCGNYGTVYAYDDEAGGIAGYGYMGIFDKCFNKGTVISGDDYAGGITAEYGYITNCYNLGEVTSQYGYAGGISAYMDSDEPIYNSFNRGPVYARYYYAGGIVGYASGGVSVVNVYNAADVYSDEDYAAIIGYLGGSESACTLKGYYDDNYTSDGLSAMTGMYHSDMCSSSFASTLNSNLGLNPDNERPWDTWHFEPLTNGGYPFFDVADDAGRYWVSEGNYSIAWYNPYSTSYNIGTAADLAGVAYLCDFGNVTFEGKTVKLTADIDLAGHEWVAIGNTFSTYFAGNFDGNNHTISNLHSELQDFSKCYGLIGYMNSSSALFIKDLTIDATCDINAPDSYVGGVASYVETNVFTISNCKNYATLTCGEYSGGVVGDLEYDDDYDNSRIEVTQCQNYGNIHCTDGYDLGGIAGYAYASNLVIDNCTNDGNIVAPATEYVAGIAGYAGGDTLLITNCRNNGNIWSDDDYIGGIAGELDGHMIMENGINTGEVKGNDGLDSYADYVGGLVGYLYASQSEVKNCLNLGDVYGDDEVGGIIGYAYGSGSVFEDYHNIYLFVTDCQNKGAIIAPYGYYDGGIVGEASGSCAWMDKCSNTGDVTGVDYVGGISGYLGSVTNSYNTGDVLASYKGGGILGYMSGSDPNYAFLGNCYNRGNVTLDDYYAGGLVGDVGEYSVLSNSYTTGEVTSPDDEGAVIGRAADGFVIMNTLFYKEDINNESGFGSPMSDADMKSNVLLDTLNANVDLWNENNPSVIQYEYWEFRDGLNDGYPVLGYSNVSVEDMADEAGTFSVYPNPATEYVMIVNEKGIRAEICLFDMFGKMVKAIATTSDELIRVDVSDLANGVYVLRMGNQTAKIVKH